ncbi:unnamed protein product [Diatraea saccharalis]|uniref:Uncharacterized protein n=1 Tax=Diatraea saccharalis TaxID=40085 RepID=A0A9N9R029_9NEOP|nr:unnamed protein product [Diatraea saccharalis]
MGSSPISECQGQCGFFKHFSLRIHYVYFQRAVNTEEEEHVQSTQSTRPTSSPGTRPTTTRTSNICARSTPCAWTIYRPVIKFIEENVTNAYCVCAKGMVCTIDEDDTSVSAYVHRCKSPLEVNS